MRAAKLSPSISHTGATMTTNAVQHDVISDIRAFHALAPEWDALWRRAGGQHFQSFAFCASSPDAQAKLAGRKLQCLAGRRQGRLVVLWPLMTCRKACWRFMRPLGPDNNSPHDILVEPGPDAAAIVAGAWHALLARARPDLVYLPRLRNGSLLHRCASDTGRVAFCLDEITPMAHMRELSGWADFCRSRVGRARNPPDYLQRRLAGQGRVDAMMIDHNDSRAAIFVDWLLLHKRRWAERGEVDSAWLFSDDSRAFLMRLMAAEDDPAGQAARPFRLAVLTLDGVTLAVNLLAVQNQCVDLLMNTYDAAYGKLSPGTALIDWCVKWAFDQHFDFNFGSGTQQYKQYWSNGAAYTTASLHVAPTQWGLAGYRLHQGARWARARLARLRGRGAEAEHGAAVPAARPGTAGEAV
ncbi:GNAT family N-acetyltransferase [Cupriavidus sp. 30B13]|uniref:GNAT family N-acetyltransferase n=1 Tax=Cupriavidus sp. 30B13 TaxID=3384241 RepID=UPI003B8FCEA4